MRFKTLVTLLLITTSASSAYAQRNVVDAKGVIYKTHKNIDNQHDMIMAMELHEFDAAFNYFLDNASFGTANFGAESIIATSGAKEYRIKFHTEFFDAISMALEWSSIYIEDENGKGGDVLFWYVFQLV